MRRFEERASQDGKDFEQFSDGHTRRLSRLTRGPFRYKRYADSYPDVVLRYTHVPVKQAVISDPMCNRLLAKGVRLEERPCKSDR